MNDINKELCELLGIQWHKAEWRVERRMWMCSACGTWDQGISACVKQNPDFISNPVALLREMRKREDWEEFMILNMDKMGEWIYNTITDYMADDTGKLAIAARDFLRREKKI